MKTYCKLFEQIGIDQKSGIIYVTLLQQWRSSISEIAQKSLLQRIEIYRKLPLLLEYGLVLEIKIGKKKLYKAGSPKILEELLSKSQHTALQEISEISEIYEYTEQRPDVVYKEGPNSITYTFQDIVQSLKKWDIFYRISSETNVEKSNTYLPKNYRQERDSKELQRYVITTQKTEKQKIPRLERETVIFPENYEQFDENVQMIIYADKIAYVDYNSESAMILKNKKLASFQEKIFKALFKSLGR